VSAYIGKVDFAEKPVEEDDDNLNSHIDTEQPKVIKLIGADLESAFLINEV